MKKKTQEISRREMLAVMAVSSLAGVTKASPFDLPNRASDSFHFTRSGIVRLDAKPDAIEIVTAKTAVIVIDMQNDFGTRGGMFDRAGIDISMIQKAVGPTATVLAAARDAGLKIIYLKMGYHPDLSDLGASDSVNRTRHLKIMHVGTTVRAPDGSESRILIRDTWNTDIVAELKPQARDVVMYKTRFSGFYQTDLDTVLKRLGMKHLIITGCTTSVCVDSTIRDAMFRDYQPVLLADCTAEPIGYGLPRSNHEASLLTIQALLGWVSSSGEFVKALGTA
ncbi:MAG TPA: cysteine hydrolase [Pyrinomonadaceae bacterium]|nr:cysteine hydrolase [Pyrinomonadaceae bacterium]